MSSIGLDTLPHSAGIITMLSTTKLTHRQGYINSFILSLVLPIVMACFAAVSYTHLDVYKRQRIAWMLRQAALK